MPTPSTKTYGSSFTAQTTSRGRCIQPGRVPRVPTSAWYATRTSMGKKKSVRSPSMGVTISGVSCTRIRYNQK